MAEATMLNGGTTVLPVSYIFFHCLASRGAGESRRAGLAKKLTPAVEPVTLLAGEPVFLSVGGIHCKLTCEICRSSEPDNLGDSDACCGLVN